MSQTFTFLLTPAQYAERRQQLANQGVTLPAGNSGEMSHSGVTVGFSYDGTQALTLSVVHKPFLISAAFVESKIREWFQA